MEVDEADKIDFGWINLFWGNYYADNVPNIIYAKNKGQQAAKLHYKVMLAIEQIGR